MSVKALCVVVVGTVTGPIRDWLWGKRDAEAKKHDSKHNLPSHDRSQEAEGGC